jgi:hypothetical protein
MSIGFSIEGSVEGTESAFLDLDLAARVPDASLTASTKPSGSLILSSVGEWLDDAFRCHSRGRISEALALATIREWLEVAMSITDNST